MIVLDKASTVAQLRELPIVAIVEDALVEQARGRVALPAESYLGWEPVPGEEARSIAMHARIDRDRPVGGVKIINANPANPGRGHPRASGVTLVFDDCSARIVAMMPAEDISAARTAAVSTAAVRRCGRSGPVLLSVIGCGPVADWHIEMLTAGIAVEHVALFDIDESRANTLAARWRRRGCDVTVRGTAREAVEAGDVVVACTTVRAPYVERVWLRPGTTFVNVSLDDLEPDGLLSCDRLFVDDWALVVADQHRLLGQLARKGLVRGPAEGDGPGRRVDGTIAELVTNELSGRFTDDDVVVINPFGMAVTDVALAAAIAERAEVVFRRST